MTNGERVPGTRLLRFAERRIDRETLERVVRPAVADLQHECGDDASRLQYIRAYWGLWKTIALCVLRDAAHASRPTVASVSKRMAVIFPIVLGAVSLMTMDGMRADPLGPSEFLLFVSPQIIALALPVAYFFAVTMEPAWDPRKLLPAIVAMSIVCTVVMLVIVLSIMPRANLAYRDAVFAKVSATAAPGEKAPTVTFGASEWTFTELVRKSIGGESPIARNILSNRLATCTAPIMLGLVALGISGYSWKIALFNGVWVLMFYVAALRAVAPSSYRGPSAGGVWLVNALFALGGLCAVFIPRKGGEPDPTIPVP
jgi:hypothetical protein